ncbi:MAG: PfkB family carbohydrate kinase, partial [Marmoricola sp.]
MIVVAGEALIDVVVDHDGDSSETPGGSPLNVAVGLARLDIPAILISQVGHDERGGLVVQHVTGSGAEIVAVPTSSGRTSVATARLDASGAARYDFDLEWSLPRQELPRSRALHVGSLGTLLEPGRESVLDLVEQACARELFVSYDANLRETFMDDRETAWRGVQSLGARCTLVKLSDEDADLLVPDSDPDDVARLLLQGERTRLVLLTRGSEGATAFTADTEVSVRPRPVEVVDTVGAG